MGNLIRRLQYWIRHRKLEQELAEELEFHRAMAQERLEQSGISPMEAGSASRRTMGSVLLAREDARAVWIWPWLDRLRQDVEYGLRLLRKSPAFTFVAVISLAIGIGANTAIFTVVNAVFLRAIPVKDASDVYVLGTSDPMVKRSLVGWNGLSLPNFQDIRLQTGLFSGLASSSVMGFQLKDKETLYPVVGEVVTSNYFDVLGIKPMLGRTFLPEDDPIQGTNAAVLSYDLWRSRFAADPSILGAQVILNSIPFSVVGIAAKEFTGTRVLGVPHQLWISLGKLQGTIPAQYADRRGTAWTAFGRVKPGMTRIQVAAQMRAISERLSKDYPPENAGRGIRVAAFRDYAHDTFSGSMLPALAGMLTTIVMTVLAIVCVNLANLQLARASYRQREISIRAALGASRRRIIGQLVTESVILSATGGAIAIFIMYWIVEWFSRSNAQNLRNIDVRLDGRVFLFAACASIGSGILFGLAPAVRLSSPDIRHMLHSSSGGSKTWHKNRLTRLLVIAQVSLSLITLVCAGLFVRLLQKAAAQDPGYEYGNVASVRLDLQKARYSPQQGKQFYADLTQRLSTIPGIEAAAVEGIAHGTSVFSEDDEHNPDYQPINSMTNSVSMNFFSGFRVKMLAGRRFSEIPEAAERPIAIVTRTLADRCWPGQDPIGKRFRFGNDTVMREVVGVLADPTYTQVPPLVVITPFEQIYEPDAYVRIRTLDDPRNHLQELRDAVRVGDPSLSIVSIEIMRDRMKEEMMAVAIVGAPMHLAALLALALAVLGIYGVTAYSLAQRSQEIGIRIALGAQRRRVIAMILVDGGRLALFGITIGIVLARSVAPALTFMPPMMNVKDPFVFLGAAIVLIAVALFACYAPARRATRVDPVEALRYD